MFKLVVLFALIAIAAARPGLISHIGTPLVYSAVPAVASGYEYSSSVHTPDYVNHQSVSAPLGTDSHYVRTLPAVYAAPAVHAYSAPLVYGHAY